MSRNFPGMKQPSMLLRSLRPGDDDYDAAVEDGLPFENPSQRQERLRKQIEEDKERDASKKAKATRRKNRKLRSTQNTKKGEQK